MTVDATFALLRPGHEPRTRLRRPDPRPQRKPCVHRHRHPRPRAMTARPRPRQTGRQILKQILGHQQHARSPRPRRCVRCKTTRHRSPSWRRSTKPSSKTSNGSAGQTSSPPAGSPTKKRAILGSPAYGPSVAALRRAEHDGHPMHRVLPALVAAAPLAIAENEEGNDANDGAQPRATSPPSFITESPAWHDHTRLDARTSAAS